MKKISERAAILFNYKNQFQKFMDVAEHQFREYYDDMDRAQWVDVKERLPDIGDEYNVVWDLKDGEPPVSGTLFFDAQKKSWHDSAGDPDKIQTVLFWRTLPKAITTKL